MQNDNNKLYRMLSRASSTLMMLTLLGCGYLPEARVQREVTRDEVIGTWVLSPESIAIAKKTNRYPYKPKVGNKHRIVLREDGTCEYSSITQVPSEYMSKEGTWALAKADDKPNMSKLKFSFTGTGYQHITLNFKEKEGALIIYEFWGDPDSWEFLEFRKKAE